VVMMVTEAAQHGHQKWGGHGSIVWAASSWPHRLRSGFLTTLPDVAGIPQGPDVQSAWPVYCRKDRTGDRG
jgi:hypothetical protein